MSKFNVLEVNYKSNCFSKELTECLLCIEKFDLTFKLNQNKFKIDKLRKHLILKHQFLISDIYEIDDLNGYLNYWKKKLLKDKNKKDICAVIKTNTKSEDFGESCDYFMLCPDILPEDKFLRNDLKIAKLYRLFEIQDEERKNTDYQRVCLFCNKNLIGTPKLFFQHLRDIHNLRLGNPNNILFANEFLDLIENKLNKNNCLFCENKFKNWKILKEHMRKKLHKTLNPCNKEYDKFYLNNYLKKNKKWLNNIDSDESDDENWEDWVEEQDDQQIKCLFCDNLTENIDFLRKHLLKEHFFDLELEFKNFSFLQKIQFINYTRKQIQLLKCIFCDKSFGCLKYLNVHLKSNNHFKIPEIIFLLKNENLHPVLENDKLLQLIADISNENELKVIPEDID